MISLSRPNHYENQVLGTRKFQVLCWFAPHRAILRHDVMHYWAQWLWQVEHYRQSPLRIRIQV